MTMKIDLDKLSKRIKLCRRNLKSKRVKCCAACPFEDIIVYQFPKMKEMFRSKKEPAR